MSDLFDLPIGKFVWEDDAQPLVSAIIPSYNKAQYLAETVKSVIDQDYKKIEILIVNDGSPDNTDQVAEELIKSYPSHSIRLLKKRNGGISDARNFGISHAAGRLILALDGDDVLRPSFVSKGLKVMREVEGVNLVTCNVEIFGTKPGKWKPARYEQFAIRYDNSIPTLVMFDKLLWKQVGGYQVAFPFVEDWDFFIKCSRYGLFVHRIEEPLFLYRSSPDGLASLFEDSYTHCLALVMTSNEGLYPVEEVTWAHDHLRRKMPEKWVQRFNQQLLLHSQAWQLLFWIGLYLEGVGDDASAKSLYNHAIANSNCENWQPIMRLALLFAKQGLREDSMRLLHRVRILRPDMAPPLEKSFLELGFPEMIGR